MPINQVYPVNLLVHWKIGEKEPWCLVTHLLDRQMALRAYALKNADRGNVRRYEKT